MFHVPVGAAWSRRRCAHGRPHGATPEHPPVLGDTHSATARGSRYGPGADALRPRGPAVPETRHQRRAHRRNVGMGPVTDPRLLVETLRVSFFRDAPSTTAASRPGSVTEIDPGGRASV